VYIKSGSSYINLAQISRAEMNDQTLRGRVSSSGYYSPNGNQISPGVVPDLERLTAPLVSSTATVLAITPTGSVSAHPIAAFRVLRAGAAEAVYANPLPADAVLFHPVGAHGLARMSDGTLFPNVETAKASVVGTQLEPVVEPEVEPVKAVAGGRRR
jgi:hypothetical protein